MSSDVNGKCALTGRAVSLLPGWQQADDRTFERADGALVWRDQRMETTQPIWWRAQDQYGFRHRGRNGMVRGYRTPEKAMAAIERIDPYFPEGV